MYLQNCQYLASTLCVLQNLHFAHNGGGCYGIDMENSLLIRIRREIAAVLIVKLFNRLNSDEEMKRNEVVISNEMISDC